MHIFLTGGTGYIGSAILKTGLAQGRQVTALVRNESAADKVEKTGAAAVIGDITDRSWLTDQLLGADALIHTATPGDATSAAMDRAVVVSASQAFAGTEKPYLHTSGAWIYGTNPLITEKSPLNPPELTAWRPGIEALAADSGIRAIIIAPGIVYGHGVGLPTLLGSDPENRSVQLVGDGNQHWTTVHVDDLADLYLLALKASKNVFYLGVSGQNPTVRELGEAASRGRGFLGSVTTEPAAQTRARFGTAFADALLLDQQATGQKAKDELGWQPTRPSLVHELEFGSYLTT